MVNLHNIFPQDCLKYHTSSSTHSTEFFFEYLVLHWIPIFLNSSELWMANFLYTYTNDSKIPNLPDSYTSQKCGIPISKTIENNILLFAEWMNNNNHSFSNNQWRTIFSPKTRLDSKLTIVTFFTQKQTSCIEGIALT